MTTRQVALIFAAWVFLAVTVLWAIATGDAS